MATFMVQKMECYCRTTVKPFIYKSHQIPKLTCFSSGLAFAFAQSIAGRCQVKNEDVVGAALTGDASTTSEWSAILIAH